MEKHTGQRGWGDHPPRTWVHSLTVQLSQPHRLGFYGGSIMWAWVIKSSALVTPIHLAPLSPPSWAGGAGRPNPIVMAWPFSSQPSS